MQSFWVGGYGIDGDGTLEGIGRVSADGDPKTLRYEGVVAQMPSPSWLTKRGNRLYAALEFAESARAIDIADDGVLVPLGGRVSIGPALCHLTATDRGLIACSWGDGTVALVQTDATGALVEAKPAAPAADPYAFGDERVSRAHASVVLPDGRVATSDLGFDLVRFWRLGASGLELDHEVTLPFGSGPRHLALHPSGFLFVDTEFSNEVFVLGSGPDGRYSIISSSGPLGLPGDASAEISISPDGYHVWVGLRGSNTIATLAVSDAGARVTPKALVEAGVDWPRFHLEHEGVLLVAGQRSNSIAALDIDSRGIPSRLLTTVDVPSPTVIVAG